MAVPELLDVAFPLDTVAPTGGWSDLEPLDDAITGADVVAIGLSERFGRELVGLRFRLLRWLVAVHGFRTIALEDDHAVAASIDEGLDDATVSTDALMSEMWQGWRTAQTVDALDWIRTWNRRHPSERVSIAGIDERSRDGARPVPDDTALADRTLAIAAARSAGTVVLGGMAHTAVAHDTSFSYPPAPAVRGHNCGAALRDRIGRRFRSIGLTFDHGDGLFGYPPAPVGFAEAALAGHQRAAIAIVPAQITEPTARSWVDRPATIRVIGPTYDPSDDVAYHMSGGTIGGWFDVLVHTDEITPVDFL